MSAVLLDTHVVHWWAAEPRRVSARASEVLEAADELAVAGISWFELAWLARHERIAVTIPIRSWLSGLAAQVRTIGVTPAIADTAVALPSSFRGDPADRLIFRPASADGRDRGSLDPLGHERQAMLDRRCESGRRTGAAQAAAWSCARR